MNEGVAARTNSFKQFLRTVGLPSGGSMRNRASTLPVAANSSSTFYQYSTEWTQSTPTKRGWLKRQAGFLKSWQARWFVLNGNFLVQYLSNEESQPLDQFVIAGHTVKELNTVDNNNDEPQKFLFEIVPNEDASHKSSDSSIILATDSSDERRDWIHAIKKVLYCDIGGAIFGQCLEDTLKYEKQRNPSGRVPEIVEICVEYLRSNGLDSDGLFRLPGRNALVRQLREAFDVGVRPSFENVDVHTVASLLKAFLRELPCPIVPFEHYDPIMHIIIRQRPIDPDGAMVALSKAIACLPQLNYDLLYYLCKFLYEVSCHSDTNRMTAFNLATIFSPCIIAPEVDDPALLAGTSTNRTFAVEEMISKFEYLFDGVVNKSAKLSPDIIAATSNIEDIETRQVINGQCEQAQPDILIVTDVDGKDDVSSEKSDENTCIECTQLEPRMSLQVQKNTSINHDSCCGFGHNSQITCEILIKIESLKKNLQTEHNLVAELRQELSEERSQAAKQQKQLAQKLDEERQATANAVQRVIELQNKLEMYSLKFGPLD